MTKKATQELIERLAVDKWNQDPATNFEESMWEDHQGPSPGSHEYIKQVAEFSPTNIIKEESEYSSKRPDPYFHIRQEKYEWKKHAKLLNLQTDQLMEELQ